jgi:hypothetical protein
MCGDLSGNRVEQNNPHAFKKRMCRSSFGGRFVSYRDDGSGKPSLAPPFPNCARELEGVCGGEVWGVGFGGG